MTSAVVLAKARTHTARSRLGGTMADDSISYEDRLLWVLAFARTTKR
jgi:hypothetical protein